MTSAREALARRTARRLRIAAAARAGEVGVVAAALGTVLLEAAARAFPFEALRLAEGVVVLGAAAAAGVLYRRARRRSRPWTEVADGDARSVDPGVFAAAAVADGPRLLPLVRARAESAAEALLAAAPPRVPRSGRSTRLAAAGVVAVAAVLAPGRAAPADLLDASALPALRRDAERLAAAATATEDAAAAASMDAAARALARPDLRRRDAAKAAEALRALSAPELVAALRAAAAAEPSLRPLADAAGAGARDEVLRATASLRDRLRADPALREAVAAALSASAAIAGAAAPELRSVAGALVSGDGAGGVDLLPDLGLRAAEAARRGLELRDVLVRLDAAAGPARAAAGEGGTAPPAGAVATTPADGAGLDATLPLDPRGWSPGTPEEVVVRRYFSGP